MKLPWSRRREIDDELRSHLRMAIEDRIARGEDPATAAAQARREFGNEHLVRETTRSMWGGWWLETWLQDVRYGVRQMRRAPGFAIVAVVTLGLGLGAAIAMSAIVESVLLRPLPYSDPSRLHSLANLPPPGVPNEYWPINGRLFHEWRAGCSSCEDVATARSTALTLTGSGEPVRLQTLSVSFNFFRTLGVPVVLGRDFLADEELPGNFHRLILTDATWRAHFSGDPSVIGQTVRANDVSHLIVGVLPADFRLPIADQWGASGPSTQPMMFRPLGQDLSQAGPAGDNNYVAVVRLGHAVDSRQATAELRALVADFVRDYSIQTVPVLLPLQATVVRGARAGLLVLGAMVATMLLVVCVNIGNLMLVRTAGRDREVAVRMALGSSGRRIFSLVLTEAFLLVLAGSVTGLVCAYAGLRLFTIWGPDEIPRLQEIQLGPGTWFMSIALVAVSTCLCGVLPAWRLARRDPQAALRTGSGHLTADGRKLRLREWLVGVEVALTTVLMVTAGLLVLSFVRVMSTPKGFDGQHVLTQDLSMSGPRFNDAARHHIIEDTLSKLAALPGVSAAASTSQLPLAGEAWVCVVRTSVIGPDRFRANYRFVSADYWRTMGIPIVQGRAFEPADRSREVAVIGESVARTLWPGENAIGKRLSACGTSRPETGLEVVGVVGDVRAGLETAPPLTVYEPYWSANGTRFHFAVRTSGDPQAAAADLRRVFRAIDPELPVTQATTMEEILAEAVAARRFQLNLATGLAIFALGLASLGIYGVISYAVGRRTREFGIRLALGSRRSALAAMVIREGMKPVFVGVTVGIVGALFMGPFVASQLYGVTARDPGTLAVVALLLTAAGACACVVPAWRAMRINPLIAIRFE